MKRLSGIKQNKKGSGIVTVMLAIVFLSALGSMMLMVSFTGFEMRGSDRQGKKLYYDTETAMSEIKTGFQDAASDAINGSLKLALPYLSYDSKTVQHNFITYYFDVLNEWKVTDSNGRVIKKDGMDYSLFTSDRISWKDTGKTELADSNATVNPKALAAMIKNCRQGVVYINTGLEAFKTYTEGNELEISEHAKVRYISGASDGKALFEFVRHVDGDITTYEGKVRFKNISLTFEDLGADRSSTVKTDLVLTIPDISATLDGTASQTLRKYAFICAKEFTQSNQSTNRSAIYGDAYMGRMEIANKNSLVFETAANGYSTCVVKKGITVSSLDKEKDRVAFENGVEFWTENIEVRENAQVRFSGITNVHNDLNINGSNAFVKIGAEEPNGCIYCGFGDGINDVTGTTDNSDISSSIIFNSVKAVLQITCNELKLAGYSFIGSNDSADELNPLKDIKSGQSIHTRVEQKLLMPDVKYIKYIAGDKNGKAIVANPIVYASQDAAKADILVLDGGGNVTYDEKGNPVYKVALDDLAAFWEVSGSDECFKDYGAKLQPFFVNRGTQCLVYFFVQFGETRDSDNKVIYSEKENQTRFLQDYYYYYPELINDYLNQYIDNENGSFVNSNDPSHSASDEFIFERDVVGKKYLSKKYNGDIVGVWYSMYKEKDDNKSTKTLLLKDVNGKECYCQMIPSKTEVSHKEMQDMQAEFQSLRTYLTHSKPLTYPDVMDTSVTDESLAEYGEKEYKVTVNEATGVKTVTGPFYYPYKNPFYYYVRTLKNSENVPKLAFTWKNRTGETGEQAIPDNTVLTLTGRNGIKAIISSKSYTYDGDNNIHLIICDGDVTVNKNFKGLIICSGNLTLNADVEIKSDSKAVNKSMGAEFEYTFSNGTKVKVSAKEFFNNFVYDENSYNNSMTGGDSLIGSVTYDGWEKS